LEGLGLLSEGLLGLREGRVQTPAYVIDRSALRANLAILRDVQEAAGCKILLALKGFAAWHFADLIREYLPGVAASSPHEARLGREEFKGEVHTYAPAFAPSSFSEILRCSDHLIFNSFSQWQRHKDEALAHSPALSCGIRINPEHSEVATAIYDPCAPGSRLGVTRAEFREEQLEGISGLHFHSLCELGADALQRTLEAVEANFGEFFPRLKWVNFGGGHHITKPGYDRELLIELVRSFREKHGLEVILEPGEAIAIRTGVLLSSVLDIVRNGDIHNAILDTSATAHMPDVLEMPYRPDILGAGPAGSKSHDYRLGGTSCLAGDVIGDYSFDEPLRVGQELMFLDMSHYTMVKTTNFNGVQLPSIASYDPEGDELRVVREFGYEGYRDRLS
jgi:carboxynorspermidine decarboxylase